MVEGSETHTKPVLDRAGREIGPLGGTFLISFALLSFEISTVRTINFAVGPSYIFCAIAFAMLGLSTAGSVLSLFKFSPGDSTRYRRLFWICVAIAVLIVLSHLTVAATKSQLDGVIEQAGRDGGLNAILQVLLSQSLPSAIRIGIVLSIPYFLFGALLAYLFATTRQRHYGRLYASDLLGAAIGCIAAILFMEFTGYATSVTMPAVAAILAAAIYALRIGPRYVALGSIGAVALAVLSQVEIFERAIEPTADPNYLVRDYRYAMTVSESWRTWNSFTRVGLIQWREGGGWYGRRIGQPDRPYAMLSLANGDGLAWLVAPRTPPQLPLVHPPTGPALLLDPPTDALILFAGAGADLLSFQENGVERVTGVELNRALVDGALARPDYGLQALTASDDFNLEVAEARMHLERDTNRYDLILVSWSGATASYYGGALSGTTQFLFTHEATRSILDHLKPDGYAVILQVNKVRSLGSLRKYLAERGLDNAPQTAIILYRPDRSSSGWDLPFDNNPLLIKPSGWTPAEISRIAAEAAEIGYAVAYAPDWPSVDGYEVYAKILNAGNVEAELDALEDLTKSRFDVVTDNRPFPLDIFSNARYFSTAYWGAFLSGDAKTHEIYHGIRVVFVAFICICAILLILGPLLARRGPPPTQHTFNFLGYFFCLGTGFMIIEISLMHKGSFIFGNPGIAIAVVLAGVILFSGIGSLISNWTTSHGLSCRLAGVLICGYGLLLYLTLDDAMHLMLTWPVIAKTLAFVAIIAPGGLLMGQLFPQGLVLAQTHDSKIVPWAWGINGATSTVAAGIAPLLAQAWGFNTLILLGSAVYGAIILFRLPSGAPAD